MTVYILHADKPLFRGTTPTGAPILSGYYTGYTQDLVARLFKHSDGKGAKFTRVWFLRGVDFALGRVWEGADREWERKVKNYKNAPLLCTICNPDALNYLSESEHGS
ncbi:MAG: hypothetical protein L0287_10060 [Anaerolineae bacterium]|nr:hypothetical protein [Anaerolineae bacterium]